MNIRYLSYFFLIIIFTSCLDSDFVTNDLIVENDINYLHPSLDRSDFPNDQFRIVGVSPSEEIFNIIVEYEGGCEEHRFYAWWDGRWQYSSPPKAAFYLSHSNRGDKCERLVRDTVQVNLNRVFLDSYPEDGAAIITLKNGFNHKSITIDPDLARIQQSQSCALEVDLKNISCLSSIWGSRGILLSDTSISHENIWLQPVRNDYDVSLDVPSSGKYHIGITLLFGYKYDTEDCDDESNDHLIPVAVHCLEML